MIKLGIKKIYVKWQCRIAKRGKYLNSCRLRGEEISSGVDLYTGDDTAVDALSLSLSRFLSPLVSTQQGGTAAVGFASGRMTSSSGPSRKVGALSKSAISNSPSVGIRG